MATTLRSTLNVNFRRDGVWYYDWSFITVGAAGVYPQNMVGSNYFTDPAYAGGYWAGNANASVGDNYEIIYAVSDVTSSITEITTGADRVRRAIAGRYSITNGASNWSSLSAMRTVTLNFQDVETDYIGTTSTSNINLTARAAMSITPTIRRAGGGPSVSGTMGTLEARLYWLVLPTGTPPPGGGGTGPGGGGGCVHRDSYVRVNQQAHQVTPGDWLRGMTEKCEFEFMRCRSNRTEFQPCVRIHMESGATLICSLSTPLTLEDGSLSFVRDLKAGMKLPVWYDNDEKHQEPWWDFVAQVEEVGDLPVQVVNIGGYSYAAGEKPGAYIYTHNSTTEKL